MLCVVCGLSFVVWCSVCVIGLLLLVVDWVMFVGFVVCCLLIVVYCERFVVLCLLSVVYSVLRC